MIDRATWSSGDRLAFLNGWSHERIGSPQVPAGAHGPDACAGLVRLLDVVPAAVRAGAWQNALQGLLPQKREGLFFDLGRLDARRS